MAAARGISVEDTLGHLLAMPAFTQPVPAADRRFTAAPGIALQQMAFELGYPQVVTRDSKAIRVGPDGKAALDAQVRAFERKFGRPPEPDEPIFFDPDADEPQPMPLVGLEQAGTDMLTAAGICDAWIYAYQHTDGLLPRPDGSFNSDKDRRDWDTAVARFLRTHPGQAVDQDMELAKLRAILALTSLHMAATDPAYGASLAHRLDQPDLDAEADVVADYLLGAADQLTATRQVTEHRQAAAELARAWAGADLAERLQHATIDPDDLPALLALAASGLPTRPRLTPVEGQVDWADACRCSLDIRLAPDEPHEGQAIARRSEWRSRRHAPSSSWTPTNNDQRRSGREGVPRASSPRQ